uniref:CSON014868 protein n=1 Tax=Culicoides sonorensis TaxID=179676 RepID=A0A336KSL0_CULSO
MGNSGSLHNLAHDEHYPPSWVQSMPRDAYHHRQASAHFPHHQVKVLPELAGGPKLRPTNNGHILQQGGTISIKNQGLQRSRSVSAPHHYEQTQQMSSFQPQFLKARSQTQINFIPRESPTRELNKRFGSESDIREKLAKENQETPPKLPPKQNKKRRAPDVPVNKNQKLPSQPPAPTNSSVKSSNNGSASRNDGVNRKLRLFKTKAETKKAQIENNTSNKLPQEASDSRPKSYTSSFARNTNSRDSDSHNSHFIRSTSGKIQGVASNSNTSNKNTSGPDWRKSVPKIPSIPIFRREKSFDISLMSEMNKRREENEHKNRGAISPPTQRRSITGRMEDRKLPKIPTPPKMTAEKRQQEPKAPVVKSYVRKQIQPIPSHKDDFQQELLQATKRRSLAVSEKDTKVIQTEMNKTSNTLKAKEKSPLKSENITKKETTPVKPVKKSPSPDKIVINVKDTPPKRSLTKSPDREATKTFYFGMSGDDKIDNQTEEDVDREQMELIDRFAESILIKQRCAMSSESALSSDNEEIELRKHDPQLLQDINLQLRPTLPRKQFEIPRFSPAAAWRLLAAEEDIKRDDTLEWLNNVEKANNSQIIEIRHDETHHGEERIERIYREPVVGVQTDNKSGDSGISGDAGLVPDRTDSPRNRARKKGIGISGTWTPQQDLGEESSTDDDPEESIKHQLTTYHHTDGHVFSLTLPRDTQTPTFSDKSEKHKQNNNHTTYEDVENYTMPAIASDNWFLSRSISTPVPLEAPQQIAISYRNNVNSIEIMEDHERRIKPVDNQETFSYLTSGKHKMYLPNKNGYNLSMVPSTSYEEEIKITKLSDKSPSREREFSPIKSDYSDEKRQELPIKVTKSKGKFTFQSTVRQVQRRKIAEKLSKEAEEMEAQRLSELEVMRKVEEEFQKKRAREKANIRHQLQLFTQEESNNGFSSFQNEWDPDQRRSEPEGASPIPENSPTGIRNTGTYKKNTKQELTRLNSNETFIDTKTPYISRIVEQKSGNCKNSSSSSKTVVDVQSYQQRSYNGERHHQSSNNNTTIIPTGNQFIRGHTYRISDTSELSEKNHHISSSSINMNGRHFESLMTSTHHITSSAYDKIFQ